MDCGSCYMDDKKIMDIGLWIQLYLRGLVGYPEVVCFWGLNMFLRSKHKEITKFKKKA